MVKNIKKKQFDRHGCFIFLICSLVMVMLTFQPSFLKSGFSKKGQKKTDISNYKAASLPKIECPKIKTSNLKIRYSTPLTEPKGSTADREELIETHLSLTSSPPPNPSLPTDHFSPGTSHDLPLPQTRRPSPAQKLPIRSQSHG